MFRELVKIYSDRTSGALPYTKSSCLKEAVRKAEAFGWETSTLPLITLPLFLDLGVLGVDHVLIGLQHEVVDAGDGMILDAFEDPSEPGF